MLLNRLRVPMRGWWVVMCCALMSAQVAAQTAASSAAASPASSPDISAADRAQRDADKVFRWIMIHSDKPRKSSAVAAPPATVVAPKDDKAVAAARAKPVARAASKPDEAVAEPAGALAAARPPTDGVARVAAKSGDATGAVVVPDRARATADDAAPTPVNVAAAAPIDVAGDVLKPISQAEPEFPASVLRGLRNGQVQVRFNVLPDGSVSEPAVVESSNRRLNPSVLAAVAQWKFAPIRQTQTGIVNLVFNNE